MNTLRLSIAIAAAILLGACATSGTAADGSDPSARRGTRDRSLLTAENLGRFPGRNLYDVILQERPHWLDVRGPSSLNSPAADAVVVYIDGSRAGSVAYLRDINAEVVASVRHLNGPEAGSRFGLNHASGAILVTSKPK